MSNSVFKVGRLKTVGRGVLHTWITALLVSAVISVPITPFACFGGGKVAMIDISRIDYSALDVPQVLSVLFHPRADYGAGPAPEGAVNISIPVGEQVKIGARFHLAGPEYPNILFFHGNGEIVSDYDDLGPLYRRMEINFLAVDYRGYGRSGGRPTITNMMRDSHRILAYVQKWLADNKHAGPLIVMGRSLGSASAVELAHHYPDQVKGLIVESGFAHGEPLLALLGINLNALNIKPGMFGNLEKIKTCNQPTLIIHAEFDHIIPFTDGQALYDAVSAGDKVLVKVPGANHNTIFAHNLEGYMNAVKNLTDRVAGRTGF
jgi:pimeloyl-ACP methyl ester carboxylesterase